MSDEIVLNHYFDIAESNHWKPSDKIPLINTEIDRLKLDLKAFLSESSWDLETIVKESQELCEESTDLIAEMKACKQDIEQETMAEILKSVETHDKISRELAKVNYIISIIYDISTCARYFKDYEDAKNDKRYNRCVEAIGDLLQLLEYATDGFEKLTMYGSVKSRALVIWEELYAEVIQKWDSLLSWSKTSIGSNNINSITLTLEDNIDSYDILNALITCKKLEMKLSEFASFVLKEVLIPIIHQDCTLSLDDENKHLEVAFDPKSETKPQYDQVIENIRFFIEFLGIRLNIEYTGSKTLMQFIANQINKEFCKILIKDCFIETIPNTLTEMQNYGRVTTCIADLQNFLITTKFFPEKDLSVLEYIQNIDVLFAERSSQYFLETARTIMLKDLSITMSIGVEVIPEDGAPSIVSGSNSEDALKILDSTVPKSLFFFPRCMISRTAQELLDLVYMMMEQAAQCSDVVCKRLYTTTRLVFELYDAVVPYHHENFLQTIPQYVALFHNNCMFLAHNMLTFGDKWLNLMEGREVDYPIGFLDLVPKLRDLGYKHLTIHMQQQRKQILDNIRSSDLNCIVVKDVLGSNAEQAIRQCLRQLQLLKNVWIGVFPINVFTRLMGTLVNMFVDELIHRVCTVEDISAEMAAQLTELYSLVVNKAPNLFKKPIDVEEHVASWARLQQLLFVLGGSLKDIEQRWGDGAGPLARHLRVEALRGLLKALFQNTRPRAELLAKIK